MDRSPVMMTKDATAATETLAGPAGGLTALCAQADRLAERLPGDEESAVPRSEAERLRQVIDAQQTLIGDGASDILAEPLPDAIPMTGEEDPLVEVEDPEFTGVVAEFMRSERGARVAHGAAARAQLAQALLPFADAPSADAAVLLAAIAHPFEHFFVALDERSYHPTDTALIATLLRIAGRAT